jgi:mannose-6-phosphate isomerase-like protein (cupin superfamily)
MGDDRYYARAASDPALVAKVAADLAQWDAAGEFLAPDDSADPASHAQAILGILAAGGQLSAVIGYLRHAEMNTLGQPRTTADERNARAERIWRWMMEAAIAARASALIMLAMLLPFVATAQAPTPTEQRRPATIGAYETAQHDIFSADFVRRMVQNPKAKNAEYVFRSSRDQRTQYAAALRNTDGAPEGHDYWDELYLIHSGEGVLELYGEWSGATTPSDGEHRGGTVRSPQSVRVSPGDMIRVPAHTTHRVRLVGDAPLLYVVIRTLIPPKR